MTVSLNYDDYHYGPASLGFEKDDGHFVKADNYQPLAAILDTVQKGVLSKRKAARNWELHARQSTAPLNVSTMITNFVSPYSDVCHRTHRTSTTN